MNQRSSGILLHPTSLPGKYGIGTLGYEAYRFVDFLSYAGQTLWQILPTCPTGHGNSPYQGLSAFAGNPLMIDLDLLVQEGDLSLDEISGGPDFPLEQVDFDTLIPWKMGLLRLAAARFMQRPGMRKEGFDRFVASETGWLQDFALFAALREEYERKSWKEWDPALIQRNPQALHRVSQHLSGEIAMHCYLQFQFYRQWFELKRYANERHVSIVGDIPIFVAYDSSDVWAEQHLYHLDDYGQPYVVAGVPPDYFAADGQLWGNPLYRWDVMQQTGYEWWIKRIQVSLGLFDMMRIDHFRGFEAYWEIPGTEKTARNGRWVPGPAWDFFGAIRGALGDMPLIAEDLGIITPDVERLRDDFGLPGMKVLQFAFDGNLDNPYLPHNHVENSVVYTGTHDNDTTHGWWQQASDKERMALAGYLQRAPGDISWELIRMAQASVSNWCILMFQDLVCLGSDERMNIPGTVEGNWLFRARTGMFHPDLAVTLREMTGTYGRLVG